MIRHIVFIVCTLAMATAGFADVGSEPDVVRVKARAKVREAWAARYQDSRHGPEVTDRVTRTVKIGRAGFVDVSNIAGDIMVTGGSGDDVQIEAVKRARARDQGDARTLLEELRIEIVESASRVEVRTVYPRNRRDYSASVDYTIRMPAGAGATIRSVSGDIRITGVRGELRAETVSGDLSTSGAARLSLAKSVSGDVQVTNANSEADVTVASVSGNVTVRGLKARALELSSVSGDVTLNEVTCERATVKTVSGALAYTGPIARNGRYEMTSHSGGVRLALTSDTGFELEATTFSGDVRSDFPITLRSSDGGGGRGRRSRAIRGFYGDASAIVNLKSFSGDIVVTRR